MERSIFFPCFGGGVSACSNSSISSLSFLLLSFIRETQRGAVVVIKVLVRSAVSEGLFLGKGEVESRRDRRGDFDPRRDTRKNNIRCRKKGYEDDLVDY
jgi:hypothetical protein